jgi:hypothetical protein
MIIGLVVPDASENETPEFVEYWYFVNAGYPPVESVKVTRIEVVDPSIADTFKIVGESPALFVVTDDDADELGEVHAEPDNALRMTIYAVPSVNPVIIIGLLVPDASKNELPPFVEY